MLFFTGLIILISFIGNNIMDYLGITEDQLKAPVFKTIGEEIFLTAVLSPLIETLLFQVLLYNIVKKVFKNTSSHLFIASFLLISSLLFALGHKYSIYYQLLTFFFGLVFSIAYLFFKKQSRYPFTCVVVIHALYNLFTTAMDHIN